MKAFLLAAGYGTRLRPITEHTPKCMVPICDVPLLAWWMRLFEKHGVSEVIVNTHYLPEAVREFIADYNSQEHSAKLIEFFEPDLLGSGGTVLANRDFVSNDDYFLICYADNLTNANLSELVKHNERNQAILTMGLFHTNKPEQCGIAAVDENGLITEFVEKPENPKSNLANAGIYVASSAIFDYFPDKDVIDFGKDVLPLLVNKMYGFEIKEYLLDIGNLDNYFKAQKEWNE